MFWRMTLSVEPLSAKMPPRPVFVMVLRRTRLLEEPHDKRTPPPYSASMPTLSRMQSAISLSVTPFSREGWSPVKRMPWGPNPEPFTRLRMVRWWRLMRRAWVAATPWFAALR